MISRIVISTAILLSCSLPVFSGVSNPDISAIGQLITSTSDAEGSYSNPELALGEVELVFDAALNPYANGRFVFSAGSEGFAVEEAYADFQKGLPLNLSIRVGKYRIPFGRMNYIHPHALSFMEAPRSMRPDDGGLIPGEESFNDVGAQLSTLIPISDIYALTLSGDLLQGNSFHMEESGTAYAWNGRILNSFSFDNGLLCEVGFSGARGFKTITPHDASFLFGGDFKAKKSFTGDKSLTFGAEWVSRKDDGEETRQGGYGFLEAKSGRCSIGMLAEQYQVPEETEWTRAIKPFISYSLLEETTLFRLAYERLMPVNGDASNGLFGQVLFSMGPHKAHQF
ncbi:MAG: hypothetical protein JNL74_00240 [Fibrobacteres bacterium]|nr:hypothetical protein [Fibrobacterota bacterium]